ncbi:expressed unknown protein [Seminavis robusta]|uniref:Translation initiation factor 5A C-terminal domain-containing protein n=1 Tax=Seminavis robusta TaxID=568900 RepID=A0A9N8E919_9STRA|nr:expressed unknown protein [Seminavis robusta]|eukprot:Sro643_g180240.1 n/a (186) ;mRNA; f:10196-10753
MSGLEDRCVMFHDAAMGTGKSKGSAKEIAALRKFLHKNQTQRFTDKATSRLFDTIQLYCKNDVVALEDREGLLEDALKMPFTVFTTKQKKTMLKWIEELRGTTGSGGKPSKKHSKAIKFSVIDLDADNKKFSLMQEESGDTFEDLPLPEGALGNQIKTAFETTEDAVDVEATLDNGKITVHTLGA